MPKRGDIREDGKVFWSLAKRCKNGEWWISPEHFKKKTEKDLDTMRSWRTKNPDKIKQIEKRFREKNRAIIAEKRKLNRDYNRNYRLKNKERLALVKSNWIANNKEKERSYKSNWKKQNPWCAVECFHRRRARIESTSEPSFETKFLAKLCQAISKGSGVPHHVDHIIPVSKGGAHRWDNLRIVPAIVNLKKGASMPITEARASLQKEAIPVEATEVKAV